MVCCQKTETEVENRVGVAGEQGGGQQEGLLGNGEQTMIWDRSKIQVLTCVPVKQRVESGRTKCSVLSCHLC